MENLKTKNKIFGILALVFGGLCIVSSIVTIALALANIRYSLYVLSLSLMFVGAHRVFLHLNKVKKNELSDILVTVCVFVLSVIVGFEKISIYFLISALFVYCLAIIFERFLKFRKKRSTHVLIRTILVTVFVFVYSFIFFFPVFHEQDGTSINNLNFIILSFSVGIFIACLKDILRPLFMRERASTMVQVIKESLAYEILMSLLVLVVFCSAYFVIFEENIITLADALWYCFSVITTIGFGDIIVVTTFGRILSVILGIYGIGIVALFTSLLVNFYNAVSKKRASKMTSDNEESKIDNKDVDKD